MADIKVYGAPWCPDCKRAKRFLGEQRVFHPAAAFVFIGLDPNTAFLKGTVELDRWGFIITDDAFQTTLPGVFAAGDVRAGSTKQLASAVGEGVRETAPPEALPPE